MWLRIPVYKRQGYPPVKISVIIPIRNEAGNIKALLQDLDNQNYPADCFEVLVINDHSTDGSMGILQEMAGKVQYNLRIFSLPKEVLYPKKEAVTMAVGIAEGELIVCTDGDCRVQKEWLSYISDFYQSKEAKFISMVVDFYQEKTFFESLQTIEFASLIASGAASMQAGFPTMCNGANMAYPKKVFLALNGYEDTAATPSGDDEYLLQKITKAYPKEVFFLKNPETIVYTEPKETIGEFFQQRKRWASKWKFQKNQSVKILAFFIFLCNFVPVLVLILTVSGNYPFYIFLAQILFKCCIEFVYLGLVLKFLKKERYIKLILILQSFYMLYIICFGIVANFGKYEWKGRKFH